LDIGANVGIFSVILCKYASRESILHAFEPNPKMAVKLRKNLGINALITAFKVHEAAIGGDSEGYTELNICAKNAGESSLKGIDFSDEKIVVPIKPLNDLLAQAPSDAQVVIKCDVEGYEYEVFAPLFEGTSLRFPDIILLEVEHKARWEFDLIEKLLHLGYKIEFEGEGNCLLIRHNL